MLKERYSLTGLISSLCKYGSARGYELEISAELERQMPAKIQALRAGGGTFVPGSAFDPAGVFTRTVTATTGPGIAKLAAQRPGIVGWAGVVRSGATVLPLTEADVSVWIDTSLPTATWSPEIAAVVPADPNFQAVLLQPKRITSQVYISRKLLAQSSIALDTFIANRLRLICSSMIDQSALYGQGPAQNQPTGIITAANTHSVTTGIPPTWGDLTKLRYLCSNYSINPDTFGYIVSPLVRQGLETTARFGTAGVSNWDGISGEVEQSKQIFDERIFAGVWSYLVIGMWGGSSEETGADLTVDAFSRAELGEVVLTISMFADIGILWPQLFAFSQANVVTPPP